MSKQYSNDQAPVLQAQQRWGVAESQARMCLRFCSPTTTARGQPPLLVSGGSASHLQDADC